MLCSIPLPGSSAYSLTITGMFFDESRLPDDAGGILLNPDGTGGMSFVIGGEVCYVLFTWRTSPC